MAKKQLLICIIIYFEKNIHLKQNMFKNGLLWTFTDSWAADCNTSEPNQINQVIKMIKLTVSYA